MTIDRKHRLLIIDDDPMVLEETALRLTGLHDLSLGYRETIAQSGQRDHSDGYDEPASHGKVPSVFDCHSGIIP